MEVPIVIFDFRNNGRPQIPGGKYEVDEVRQYLIYKITQIDHFPEILQPSSFFLQAILLPPIALAFWGKHYDPINGPNIITKTMPMEIILDKWIAHVDHLNTQRIAATESVEVLSVSYKPVSWVIFCRK